MKVAFAVTSPVTVHKFVVVGPVTPDKVTPLSFKRYPASGRSTTRTLSPIGTVEPEAIKLPFSLYNKIEPFATSLMVTSAPAFCPNSALTVKSPVSVTLLPFSESPFIVNDFNWEFTSGVATICKTVPCRKEAPDATSASSALSERPPLPAVSIDTVCMIGEKFAV